MRPLWFRTFEKRSEWSERSSPLHLGEVFQAAGTQNGKIFKFASGVEGPPRRQVDLNEEGEGRLLMR